MKLVVALGNPGKEYDNTRHNVGFSFIDYYLSEKKYDVYWKKKFNALYFELKNFSEKIIFIKPQTYMNLSGESVKKYLEYYNISIDDLLVISDDLDLKLGNYKLKMSGSSGGHNGLSNIEFMLGSNKYKRIKIGISRNLLISSKDYVLGKFSNQEKKILIDTFSKLVYILDDYYSIPFEKLMSKYNYKNR